MAGTIQRLEIFATGTWNPSTGELTVTEQDLDEIVRAFNELQGTNIVKPHLKLGHEDTQRWFGQDKGAPALGWITRVWREGKKLLADVGNVPQSLLDLIRQGRYHNVSAEIYWGAPIEHAGTTFSRVLSAVALLGVEMPAVKDLAGLANALFSFESKVDTTPTTFSWEKPMPDPVTYTKEQVDDAIARAVATAQEAFGAQLESVKAELGVATDRAKAAETKLANVAAEAAKANATATVDAAIKDGKLLPKQRDAAITLLSSGDATVKFGEGEKSLADVFKAFLDSSGKQVDLSEAGSGQHRKVSFASAAEEMDHLVRAEIAKDSKLDYAKAFAKVKASNADLAAKYAAGQ